MTQQYYSEAGESGGLFAFWGNLKIATKILLGSQCFVSYCRRYGDRFLYVV